MWIGNLCIAYIPAMIEKYFFEEKFCIICKDRAHRISFDPEQAARNKNYTYYGNSKYEKHGSFGFIIL